MKVVSIRGAITVEENTESCILDGTKELIRAIEKANSLDKTDVFSILFTATDDLDKAYPAKGARELGYNDAGLMCFNEMVVEGSIRKCIRIMMLCNLETEQSKVKHIYLKEAKVLRPDLSNKA